VGSFFAAKLVIPTAVSYQKQLPKLAPKGGRNLRR